MDDPSRYHWYGEEPFPLLPVVAAFVVGVVLLPLLGWAALEMFDCDMGAVL